LISGALVEKGSICRGRRIVESDDTAHYRAGLIDEGRITCPGVIVKLCQGLPALDRAFGDDGGISGGRAVMKKGPPTMLSVLRRRSFIGNGRLTGCRAIVEVRGPGCGKPCLTAVKEGRIAGAGGIKEAGGAIVRVTKDRCASRRRAVNKIDIAG
jgi:hypothetical protein